MLFWSYIFSSIRALVLFSFWLINNIKHIYTQVSVFLVFFFYIISPLTLPHESSFPSFIQHFYFFSWALILLVVLQKCDCLEVENKYHLNSINAIYLFFGLVNMIQG